MIWHIHLNLRLWTEQWSGRYISGLRSDILQEMENVLHFHIAVERCGVLIELHLWRDKVVNKKFNSKWKWRTPLYQEISPPHEVLYLLDSWTWKMVEIFHTASVMELS